MKFLVFLFMFPVLIWANDAKVLFQKYCISCHIPFIPMSKLKENFLDNNNTLLHLKAPTLNQLSYRLKQRIGDRHGDEELHRMEVTAFMSDYVLYPDRDKSVCLDDVMQFFQTMPSLKGKVNEEELDAIGSYLYDFDKVVVKEKGIAYKAFGEALGIAKKTHKIIMIEAMSKGCHFCRKMEREVMIEKEVKDAIKKHFVPVSIDISQHRLPLGLKAVVTPTFIFIDAKKNILLTMPGAWKKEDFLALLKEAVDILNEKEKQ